MTAGDRLWQRTGATREKCRRTVSGGGFVGRNSGRRGGRHEVRPPATRTFDQEQSSRSRMWPVCGSQIGNVGLPALMPANPTDSLSLRSTTPAYFHILPGLQEGISATACWDHPRWPVRGAGGRSGGGHVPVRTRSPMMHESTFNIKNPHDFLKRNGHPAAQGVYSG